MRLEEGECFENGMRSLTDECSTVGIFDEERQVHEFEERLRVDRRKLEQMLQGVEYDCKEESADEFFHRIMIETGTHIYWPSQLKVGAKSKKDPHIKICGKAEAVWKAKEKILEVLDAKRNRVTLKMDVSFTDHSHIIGKGGHNIQQVMEETGCHIHFPDSNRSNQLEKSNQVSITGEPAGVEKARSLVRDLLPVVFTFELPVTGFLQPIADSSSPDLQFIQQACGFTVSFRQRSKGTPTTVVVRGCQKNFSESHKGIQILMEYLTGTKGASLPVTMSLEISPQHHAFVMGRGGINIHKIMQQTSSTITFPRSSAPSEQSQQRKSTVLISGNIEGVYGAWQHLMNLLPLVLMFDLKEGQDVDASCLNRTLEQLNISILLRPKQKYNTKSVTVKGPEKDSLLLFDVRKRLLGLDNTEFPPSHNKKYLPCTTAVVSSKKPGNNIQDSPDQFLDSLLTAQNSTNVMQLLNSYGRQCLSINSAACSPLSSSLSNPLLPLLLSQLSSGVGGSSQLGSPLLDVANGIVSHMACKPSPQRESEPSVAVGHISCPPERSRHSPVLSDAPCSCNPCKDETDLLSLQKGLGSSYQGDWMTWHSEKELGFPRRPSLTTENASNILGIVPSESLADHDSSDSVPLSTLNSCSSNLNHRKEIGSIGCERKKSLMQNSFPPDYEEKKLLASRAMQKPIGSEARVPTNLWSGLGFSSSMPESIVKQRLNQVGVLASNSLHSSDEDLPTSKEIFKEDCNGLVKPSLSRPEILHNFSGENVFSTSNYFEAIIPKSQSVHPETEDLPHLLARQGLAKYVDTFHQQEIDLSIFLTMTDHDLLGLGITYGARRKMLRIISEITLQQIPPKQGKQFQAAPGAERSSLFFSRLAGQRPSPRLVDPCW